jgi:single-stranded DNA-binding protein
MTVGVSRRVRQDGEWRAELDGYFRCVAFGELAEHAAQSLRKGMRVLNDRPAAAGQLRER